MNLHVPQTEEARTEALMLMGVSQNVCSPKDGCLVVSAIQDFLICAYMVTKKDVFMDRTQFYRLLTFINDGDSAPTIPTPAVIKPVELWTGKQLFSMIIRENPESTISVDVECAEKTYTRKGQFMCPADGWVCIRDSTLLCGNVGKGTLGSGGKTGLFSLLTRDYRSEIAMKCMSRLAKLSSRWLGIHGFSIGIDDVTATSKLVEAKHEVVKEGYANCENHIQLYREGRLLLQPGCDQDQTLEVLVSSELNKIREEAAKLCINELHPKNSALNMAQCGSKGSPLNISQMVACVGQQTVNGQRIENGFKHRTLPHFDKDTKSPDSKGFVQSSFYSGMTPTEFFFHTMSGREGLVDTAVKTAETGYMSRRLMKAMEDLTVQYDNSVRTCTGIVVQFTYGDDSLDPVEVEDSDGTAVNFERILRFVMARVRSDVESGLLPSEIRERIGLKKEDDNTPETEGMLERMTPENLKGADKGFFLAWKKSCKDFLRDKADAYEAIRRKLKLPVNKKNMNRPEHEYLACLHTLNVRQMENFVRICMFKYEKKLIHPGSAVGALAAHSIGEPGTQVSCAHAPRARSSE